MGGGLDPQGMSNGMTPREKPSIRVDPQKKPSIPVSLRMRIPKRFIQPTAGLGHPTHLIPNCFSFPQKGRFGPRWFLVPCWFLIYF